MSKIIRTRKPSVLPYYAAALVFVVLCAVLPVYRLWALAAALAAAAAAFLAAKKVCPVWWKPRCPSTRVWRTWTPCWQTFRRSWTLCTA